MTLYYNNFINKIPSRPNMSNVPNMSNIPYNMSNIPNVPNMSNIPYNMSNIPNVPNMSNIPNVPNMSNVPYNMSNVPDLPNMNLEELEKQIPFNRSLNTREYRKEFSDIKEYTSSELLLVEIKTYLFYILVLLIIIVFKLIMY